MRSTADDERLIRDAHRVVMGRGTASTKEALEQAQELLEGQGRTGLSAKLGRFLALHMNETTTQGDLLEEFVAYTKNGNGQGSSKGSTSKAKTSATSNNEKSAG